MNVKNVILAIAVTLALLWIIGKLTSPSKQGPNVAASSPGGQTIAPDAWTVKADRSPMDDSRTVALWLDSPDKLQGPVGAVTPTLIVRCKEKKSEVYVSTGVAASIETDEFDGGPADYHTARLRLDNGLSRTEHWGEATDHKALFAPDGIALAKDLANAQQLTFEFTPFDGNPTVLRFKVRGLDSHLNQVADACGWSGN
jgi:type VI secretion system protein VasI